MSSNSYLNLDCCGQDSWKLAELALNSDDKWRLQHRSEDSRNVYYHICLVPPRGQKYVIKLPWDGQEFCPTCLGQGLIYIWRQELEVYEAVACWDCQGLDPQPNETEINLVISDKVVGRQIIRKSLDTRRKSLILKLTWVETLPEAVS